MLEGKAKKILDMSYTRGLGCDAGFEAKVKTPRAGKHTNCQRIFAPCESNNLLVFHKSS